MNKEIMLAFFDFDDTLIINPIRSKDWRGYEEELVKLNNAEDKRKLELYRKSFVAEDMIGFVGTVTCACESYVLSHEISSQWLEPKRALVNKYYGTMFKDVIIAGSIEAKITIMKAIMKARDLCPNEVLFVDDNVIAQDLARKEGFVVVSPIEILGHKNSEALAASIVAGY